MKKLLALTLAMFMTLSLMTACTTDTSDSGTSQDTETSQDNDTSVDSEPLKIVTTIFPIYDWAVNILGDEIENVEITMLLDNGVDLHSYEPTADDMITILECDLFIYVGGDSDYWVDDTLKNATNEDMQVINLFDVLGDLIKEEEIVEGMEDDHDHDDEEESEEEDHDHDDEEESEEEEHDHDDEEESEEEDHDHDDEEESEEEDHDHDDEEESEEEHVHEDEDDEHVWLSLYNAELICNAITEKLNLIDSENSDVYTENNNSYIEQLQALNTEYEEVIANATINTLLFGDRFPFRYLVDDYNIEYYAAFPGCSAETEASFETITFLASKVDELDLSYILVIDNSSTDIADTIISNTEDKDQEVLVLDSMQSITSNDVENGTTYLSIMESNLLVLEEVLN